MNSKEKRGKQYAPVLIATLNRYEHLKRCLESLEKNLGADDTEVYISLDYPPSSIYADGYKKVKAYLEKATFAFKKTHIYYQENNLGPSDNFNFLLDLVRENHERYIMTEDDNEFSRNFLDYINKGLDYYENDPKVYAICGFRFNELDDMGNDVFCSKMFAALGYGSWVKKEELVEKAGEYMLSLNAMKIKSIIKLFFKNPEICRLYISSFLCTDGGLFWNNGKMSRADILLSVCMYMTDLCCIEPKITKSRTWGFDGSGIHTPVKKYDVEHMWPLDESEFFDMSCFNDYVFNKINYKNGKKILKIKIRPFLVMIIEYFILCWFRYDRMKAIAFIKKLKKEE